ncbi:ninjurin-2 isoform X3 [Condylostylus longicornis]|uniref:ninjurin-2 isoform X3 n=1 Tax=Condylostylus longicornis TaxID=2530218 RepID=UPI00244E51AA|nr:ninjurin-2 isoform X3 [Condylostylus longicornis]
MLDCCGKKAKDVVDDGNNNNNTENGVGTGEQNNEGMKAIDANRYATKKTIAQGMLDIALLTANASQLKYILQVGERHDFYKLMLGLISTSIILQVLSGLLNLSCTLMRDCRLHIEKYRISAEFWNHVRTAMAFFTTAINIFISAFDSSRNPDY